jgi:hypothetical protein
VAQTKRKRRSKHRGNAAGTIEARGRTGRKPEPQAKKKQTARERRNQRLAQPPTWQKATLRAAAAAGLLFVLTQVGLFQQDVPLGQAIAVCLFAMLIYIPIGYMFDNWMYKRFSKQQQQPPPAKRR